MKQSDAKTIGLTIEPSRSPRHSHPCFSLANLFGQHTTMTTMTEVSKVKDTERATFNFQAAQKAADAAQTQSKTPNSLSDAVCLDIDQSIQISWSMVKKHYEFSQSGGDGLAVSVITGMGVTLEVAP